MMELFASGCPIYDDWRKAHGEWLQAVANLYDLIVLTGSDGYYVEAFAREEKSFDKLEAPLAQSLEIIEHNPWFQQNKDDLHWDGEFNLCLMKNN